MKQTFKQKDKHIKSISQIHNLDVVSICGFSPNCFVFAPNGNNIQGSAAFYLNSSYVIAVQKVSERD